MTTKQRTQVKPPQILRDLFSMAGIRVNGDQPWDIQVYDAKVYSQILYKGSLGFGDAYVDGLWDAASLDETFHRLLSVDIEEKLRGFARIRLVAEAMRHRLLNLQSPERAFEVGERHYDIGNDVFEAMLDSSMSYSCAYWQNAENLEQAQRNKLEMICRKLELKAGEELLEIGFGWGGLARHAAANHGVKVLGITVSKEQFKLAHAASGDSR